MVFYKIRKNNDKDLFLFFFVHTKFTLLLMKTIKFVNYIRILNKNFPNKKYQNTFVVKNFNTIINSFIKLD